MVGDDRDRRALPRKSSQLAFALNSQTGTPRTRPNLSRLHRPRSKATQCSSTPFYWLPEIVSAPQYSTRSIR
jgi:hypothetical protein